MAKKKQPLDNENKLELAKQIAEKSLRIKKTYTNVESKVIKAFRTISTWIDFILFNQRFSKLVALFLAAILYLVINGGTKDSAFITSMKQSTVLENVKVTTNVSDSVYEVTGLPETVKVTLRGETSDIQFASQERDSYRVIADLSEVSEGVHEVKLEPMNFSSRVEVSIEPSSAVVNVEKKISKSFLVGYDYINTDKLDKIYSLGEPTFSQNEVIVRASEETMNQISYVKALIDVDGVKADFQKDAKLVAYNQEGEKVNVNILPESVNVNVKVTTPSKKVPIAIVSQGKMDSSLAIESFTLDKEEITLYAPQNVLDTVDNVEITIPIDKITKDTSITMPVMLPSGVSKGNVSKVTIKVKVAESTNKDVMDVPISYKNVSKNLKVVNDLEQMKVIVNVKGTKANVDKAVAEDLNVVLDLSDINKPGTYEIPLKVSGKSNVLLYTLKTTMIKVTMEEK